MRISLIILGLLSMACLWDDDTVEMEFQQFPGTIELISGHFLRHSPEFYYWRIQDRQQKLASADSLQWYDDIAVAYSKLGNDPKAIEITQTVLKRFPERYESLANLGTFYIHNGQYQEGLAFLEEAIRINPEAHFGREKYQIALVEYLIAINWQTDKKLPLQLNWDRNARWREKHYYTDLAQYDSIAKARVEADPKRYPKVETPSFYEFLLAKYRKEVDPTSPKLPLPELQNAIKGVSGMIKFGNHHSPILMEVLGELLVYDYDLEYGNRSLAIAAFLRAAALSQDSSIAAVYDQKVYQIMEGKGGYNYSPLKRYRDLLMREVKAAEANYDNIRQDEIDWILAGKDPEKEFAAKYYRNSKIKKNDWTYALASKRKDNQWMRTFESLRRDDLVRLEWKTDKKELEIDQQLKSYLDSIAPGPEPAKTEMEVEIESEEEDSSGNDIWYALIIGFALLSGGIYAYKNRA